MDLKRAVEVTADWEAEDPGRKQVIIKQLLSIGVLDKINEKSQSVSICTKHKHFLAKPCNLKNCPLHISHERSFNCINISLMKTKKYSTKEIASLLNASSTSEITQSINKSINQMRWEVLAEQIENDSSVRFCYIPGQCVTCGQNLDEEFKDLDFDLVINSDLKFGYCSSDCAHKFPKWKFYAEHKLGITIEKILDIAVSHYGKNSTVLSQIFECSKEQISSTLATSNLQ